MSCLVLAFTRYGLANFYGLLAKSIPYLATQLAYFALALLSFVLFAVSYTGEKISFPKEEKRWRCSRRKSPKGPSPSILGKLDRRTWLILLAINLAFLGASLYVFLLSINAIAALGLLLVLEFSMGWSSSSFGRPFTAMTAFPGGVYEDIRLFRHLYSRWPCPSIMPSKNASVTRARRWRSGLRSLLEGIDSDKSVAPYIAFSENFHSMEIRQLLISIYRMVDEGGGESYIRQFNVLVREFASQPS
jgi:hypothetical protein